MRICHLLEPGRSIAILIIVLLVSACSPPITVKRVDPQRAFRVTSENEITAGVLSRYTRNLLFDHDLAERYDKDPAGALAALHASFVAGNELHEDLAAAAELNFHYAEHGGGRPYYLATAVYAWEYLFPDDPSLRPDRFSPRLRFVTDLYNRAVTQALKNGKNVAPRGGSEALPFGTLDIAFDASTLKWSVHELTDFVPIAELEVRGLPTYHRWGGIGAPLAAGVKPPADDTKVGDILGRRVRVPVTVLLRFEHLMETLGSKRFQAKLEIYPGYSDAKVTIAGQEVPLESEPTAALALTLADSPVWSTELRGFLRGTLLQDQTRLVAVSPYYPGSIPVVFVHGTASSAGRWAEMYNELDNDPRLHGKFQFWFFSYETGNPIAYSAMRLHDALTSAVQLLDPEGRDPAMQHMVVIGHSQGGLLTKTTVVDSGDAFWNNVSRKPIDEINVSDSTRALLRKLTFFKPLPFVRRVVFISTPHHGSYIAGSWLAHKVARLVRAPLDITKTVTEVLTRDRDALAANIVKGVPSAVDNMTPGNPFVKTLLDRPIAPGVHAHSIISVKDGVASPTGNDGVVDYASAHIDGVDSELVVKSPHSCQSNPHTIGEVRRILLAHLAETQAAPETRRVVAHESPSDIRAKPAGKRIKARR